jgi:hypothetical protein
MLAVGSLTVAVWDEVVGMGQSFQDRSDSIMVSAATS